MPQRLPLSIQDFRKIIEYDMLYVDKTEYVYKMAVQPAAYFLSRPRRFGKSITVAVLQELYSGSRELFKGLWIEDKWDWNRKHPVIRISLKDINFEQRGLESPLAKRILEIATRNNIKLQTTAARDRFRELITVLSDTAKVVVLIDEYDAPITYYLGKDIQQATENRDYLRGFYSVLKEADQLLELVFITGVSKFSKVDIFSGLNNLVDMSSAPQFATMFGYTQAELEHYFPDHIATIAEQMKLSQEALVAKMRDWCYLTIKYRDEFGLYHLDSPNYEVKNAMLAYLLDAYSGVHRGGGVVLAIKLEQAFMAQDIEKVIRILQGMFKGIPYQLYEKQPESFYHAATHLLFSYMGLRVKSEVCTSDGRVDSVVETKTHVYILKFKLDESPEAALEQIRSKKYYQAWWERGKPVVGTGIQFSSQSRNIAEWKMEEMA